MGGSVESTEEVGDGQFELLYFFEDLEGGVLVGEAERGEGVEGVEVLGDEGVDENRALGEGQAAVVVLEEGEGAAHDGAGLEDNEGVEELEHEFDGDMELVGEAFGEAHEVDEEGVGEVDAFTVEFVMGYFESLYSLAYNALVHDVGHDFLNDLAVLLLDGGQFEDWELVDCEGAAWAF